MRNHHLLQLELIVINLRQAKDSTICRIWYLLLLLGPFIFIIHGFTTWRLLRKGALCLDDAKVWLIVRLPRKLFNLVVVLRKAGSCYWYWWGHQNSCFLTKVSILCLNHHLRRIIIFRVHSKVTFYWPQPLRGTILSLIVLIVIHTLALNNLRKPHCTVYLLISLVSWVHSSSTSPFVERFIARNRIFF